MSLLWATKIRPCLFCIETFHVQCQLFKSNSLTRGTLHFQRQPRSCEVAPTLRQFHFQTSVLGIIVPDVLKMIVCQWSQMNAISRLMEISEQQKIVFVQFVPVFAYKYNKSSRIHYVNRCFTGHQATLAEKIVRLPCKLRKPELSLQGQRKSLPSSGSDHLVLEMISMSRDVQVFVSWRLFALKVPCTSCFLGQYGRVSERRGGQVESCPCSSWLGATMACSGQLASWFAAGKLRFLTDGKLGESDISHRTCQLSIQIFLAWLKTKLSATPPSSLACLFCMHILQQRFLVLNSATSNLLVTSFRPDFDPLHCQSLSMFQVVVEKVLTLMPPTTKSASLGFITWQAKIDKLTIMKCLLFASWKARTTHSPAGYTHQTVKRHGVVVRAHLDFTSSE